MRLLTFNIAYGTGGPRSMRNSLFSAHHYLRAPRRNMEKICRFIHAYDPDLVALVEIDTGSFRTRYEDQTRQIAAALEDSFSCSEIKYHEHSIGRKIPILRKQANAILCKGSLPEVKYHYLPVGFKRLVIQLALPDWNLYLVHLALHASTRRKQLAALREWIDPAKPCIVTGDFNTLTGAQEVAPLCEEFQLVNPNRTGRPTFPAWAPEKQLDFMLCSRSIRIERFQIPQVRCSDHLPLILDFDVTVP